jgi:DNA-binding transcriptional MerR regulator
MTVADLASKVGVPPHVIRYYARIGLLNAVRNPNNGYRDFDVKDIERMHFIRRAQQLGFPLREISAVLEELRGAQVPVLLERRMLEQQLRHTRMELAKLRRRQAWLRCALNRYAELGTVSTDLAAVNRWLDECLELNLNS